MPLTQEQQVLVDKNAASLPEVHQPASLANYSEGYFFISLSTRDEAPLLGRVEGSTSASAGSTDALHVNANDLGFRVIRAWESIPVSHPNVRLIESELLPEHFYGILELTPDINHHLDHVFDDFLATCSHDYWDMLELPWREKTEDRFYTGTTIRKPEVKPRTCITSFVRHPLFMSGSNDVIPITPAEVQLKIDNIQAEKKNRLLKGNYHQQLKVIRNQHSPNWTVDTPADAVAAEPFFSHSIVPSLKAQIHVTRRLTDGLDYLGNRAIMMNPHKLPLICHRAEAAHFDEQKAAVIDAARKGYVIVSAFISPKEREIKDQLMAEELPIIEIMNNGFDEHYKPYGRDYYVCAEGRLIQITPWSYSSIHCDTKVQREMCLVMNQLARVITKQPDSWWMTWKG